MPDTTNTTATKTLDPATLSFALSTISEVIGLTDWQPSLGGNSMVQQEFLDWHNRNSGQVMSLEQLIAMSSNSADDLNKFLVDHGFKGLFQEIPQGGVGAAAILDMKVQWALLAQLTDVISANQNDGKLEVFTGFEVPLQGATIYEVGNTKLVRLHTKEGDSLWLLMSDAPVNHPFNMIAQAEKSMIEAVLADTTWVSSVIVPCVEIDTTTMLEWMLGLNVSDHIIDQAFQMVKIGMDETGAYAKTASGLGTMRSAIARTPAPLVFDRPFYGWFTQASSSVPIACFFANKDSWKLA